MTSSIINTDSTVTITTPDGMVWTVKGEVSHTGQFDSVIGRELEFRLVGRVVSVNPVIPKAASLPAELEGMVRELNAMPQSVTGPMADWYADRHIASADGWQWLARNRKFLAHDRGLFFWLPPRYDGGPVDRPDSACARLPKDVVELIKTTCREVIGRNRGEFDTLHEAFKVAAECLAACGV